MLTLINNSMNINSERKSKLNPARAVSLRLLIGVDFRSAQPGLLFASNNLLHRRIVAKTSSRTSRRSANFLKGNKNVSSCSKSFVVRRDGLSRCPGIMDGVEKTLMASLRRYFGCKVRRVFSVDKSRCRGGFGEKNIVYGFCR